MDEPQCRICFEGACSDNDPLISPCLCSGSIAFVHLRCLSRWITISNNTHCNMCGANYTFIPRNNEKNTVAGALKVLRLLLRLLSTFMVISLYFVLVETNDNTLFIALLSGGVWFLLVVVIKALESLNEFNNNYHLSDENV